jgi:hypothetical protein
MLILAHYSMQLIPAFLLEGCLATVFKQALAKSEMVYDKPIALSPFFEVCRMYAEVFTNEHLGHFDVTPTTIMRRVQFFVDKGIFELSEDRSTVKITNKEKYLTMMNFFSNLILPLIDTYLITLTTIEQICGKNLVLKEKRLVKELHNGIKTLYSLGSIPMLHSCLQEIIKTAIERFGNMGLLEVTSYATSKGSSKAFLQCPAESSAKIQELLA